MRNSKGQFIKGGKPSDNWYKLMVGRTPWNKGTKGKCKAWNKGKKYPQFSGTNHPLWKGKRVGYYALHAWVDRWKGKPKKCEICGTESAKKYEWMNIDHKYRRVLEDYIRACTKCHRIYDRDRGVKVGR